MCQKNILETDNVNMYFTFLILFLHSTYLFNLTFAIVGMFVDCSLHYNILYIFFIACFDIVNIFSQKSNWQTKGNYAMLRFW